MSLGLTKSICPRTQETGMAAMMEKVFYIVNHRVNGVGSNGIVKYKASVHI